LVQKPIAEVIPSVEQFQRDLKLTADHLKVAKWNAGQAKKAIAVVGQAKNQKADR